MKNLKRWMNLFLAEMILSISVCGCSREETIHYFNKTEETVVDNAVAETESVDNFSAEMNDTEAFMDTESDGEAVPEEAASEEAEKYTGPSVSLIMVGDILLHTPVEESAKREDQSYDFDAIFANTKEEIEEADLAIVNQEVIIGGEELGVSGYPCFNAPFEAGDALVDAGFDVVCHGTNHALDQGKKGLTNCLNFWKKNYPQIAVLGINQSSAEQDTIYVYEQDGIRIAVLNYTYGTNGIDLPSDMPYAVNLLEEEKVTEDLQKANELADFVVVCPHWGTEYELGVTSAQKKWTELFLENGVDLVIGTHPHVIEPIEVITDEKTGNEMLVYYSLGNFVNWTSSSGEGIANRMVGGMAEVTIGMDENGEAFIVDYGVDALVCHVETGTDGVTTYKLSEYTDALADKNEIINQDPAFSREYCVDLCNEIWGDQWN